MNLLESIGGPDGCLRLSRAFYARVADDPLLRPLFPGNSFRCATMELAAYLVQLLGGPAEVMQFRWWLSLHESHLRVRIGDQERAAWMRNMRAAIEDDPMPAGAKGALDSLFATASAYLVNQGEPKLLRPLAALDVHTSEALRRWDAQQALDRAVTAVRNGDVERAIEGAQSDSVRSMGRATFAGLLAQMVVIGMPELCDYVEQQLLSDPSLAHERYASRTLLHAAGASGNVRIVEVLLRIGADPGVEDGGGHTPLYSAANECRSAGGPGVVLALVRAGADVNACAGAKRCTPLHMAARRGNVEVAATLLDCGAQMEARDSLGETPLRRAVNCGKVQMAAMLIGRGANTHSAAKDGKSPALAARTGAMQALFTIHK